MATWTARGLVFDWNESKNRDGAHRPSEDDDMGVPVVSTCRLAGPAGRDQVRILTCLGAGCSPGWR
jgi:hypothetical protein